MKMNPSLNPMTNFQVQRLKVISAAPAIERFPGNSKSGQSISGKTEYVVLRGSNLTVNCDVARGIPYPQISWKRTLVNKADYNNLLTGKRGRLITFKLVNKAGYYFINR
jgi:hypothetical protein